MTNDIFILPSYSEGMPNVLLEAMSCGLIVVGAEIPGIIENLSSELFMGGKNKQDYPFGVLIFHGFNIL